MENKQTINEIKSLVLELIKENSWREVTSETKHKNSGIYMIYIDEFASDKAVPFYIGQSKDIQRRYKQHLTELLALNRLSYDEYYNYFFANKISFYEGAFKSCKIFKYMIDNNCSLEKFRMVILDELDEDLLDEKEQYYFRRLLPSFFGFNQLNSFLERNKWRRSKVNMSRSDIDIFLSMLKDDIENTNIYYNYGFTRFNFEHSMSTDISFLKEESLDSNIQIRFDEANINLYEMNKKYKPEFETVQIMATNLGELNQNYTDAKEEFYEALDFLKRQIDKKFNKYKLYSEKAKVNFIYSNLKKDSLPYKEKFESYLKSRHCSKDFYKIFSSQIKNVKEKFVHKNNKEVPYEEALDLYNTIINKKRMKRYNMIIPNRSFNSFSLGERSQAPFTKILKHNLSLNTCYIQIYISNNGIVRSYLRKAPHVIRMDYCFLNYEGKLLEGSYYIDNETTRNCQFGNEYYEQDFYNIFAISRERFKITSMINGEQDNTFISILAEYKHGINDYTIKHKQLFKLTDLLDRIKGLTNDDTKYDINLSESYKCLELCMINEKLETDPWVKKLLSKKLPKPKKTNRAIKL